MKPALITGGTDGIGRGLAMALARKGHSVHITGRNAGRADDMLRDLQALNPEGDHKKYLFDLSDIDAVRRFANAYREEHQSLDLLVLNANSAVRTIQLTDDGIEKNFAVGYVSRYMLSMMLDGILSAGNGRVVHIGIASQARKLNFDLLQQTDYGIFKATAQAYAADTLLAAQINQLGISEVPHEMHDPGLVNTQQVKQQGFLLRTIGTLFAREADAVGEIIATHLTTVRGAHASGRNYKLGKTAKVSRAALDQAAFERLMKLSAELTGCHDTSKTRDC